MTPKLLQSVQRYSGGQKLQKSPLGLKVSKVSVNSSLQNQTGTEYMELHGSTVIMASDDSSANPLVAIIVITSIFLFMTLSVTVAILVFCRKKNTVFVLQKCEQEDEISYELDEMNNTDIESADFEAEHEAMQPKARKSATCPNLLDSVEREDSQCLQLLLDTTESETDDSGKERYSPVHHKLKCRSKSFTFQGRGCHGYQQMLVTAVMETKNISKSTEGQNGNGGLLHRNEGVNVSRDDTNADNFHSIPFRSEINLYSGKEVPIWEYDSQNIAAKDKSSARSLHVVHNFDAYHQPLTDISNCFNDAKLAFLDSDTEDETTQFNVLPENVDEEYTNIKSISACLNTQSACCQATWKFPKTTHNSTVQSNCSTTSCDLPSSSDQSTSGYSSVTTSSTKCSDHQRDNQSNPSSQKDISQQEFAFQTPVTSPLTMSGATQINCNNTCFSDTSHSTNQNSACKLHVNSAVQSEPMSHAACDPRSQDSSPVTDKTGLLEKP